MNYNNKEAGINQSWSDIGSRTLWEPLTKDTLDLIFKNIFLRESILSSYLRLKDVKVDWQEEYGYFVYGACNKIHILASRRDKRLAIKELVDVYNQLSKHYAEASEDDIDDAEKKIKELNSEFVRKFSELVSLCHISDYPAKTGGIKQAYFGVGAAGPLYRLESVYTQDTGAVAGINLISIPTTYADPNLNANSPTTQTADARDVKSNPPKVGDFEAEGLAKAEAFLDVSSKPADDRPVNDPDAAPNVDPWFQKPGEPAKLYPDTKKGTALGTHGGKQRVDYTTEEQRGRGTHHCAFLEQGTMVNPDIISPSAFFYPNKGLIRNIFNPLAVVFENPYMILGLIALGTQQAKGKNHTDTYNKLPLQVTDNQELKDELTS